MRSRTQLVFWGAAVVIAALVFVLLRARRDTTDAGTPNSSSADGAAPVRFVPTGPPKTIGPDGGFAPLRTTLRDKPTRDDLRERIYRASGQSVPAFSGAQKRAESDAQVLDKDYIAKRLRDDFIPLARECYEAALVKSPKLAGKLIFDFAIVGDDSVGGIVETAELAPESTIQDPELSLCMRESMLSMSFVPPPNDGTVTVRFPVTLSPDDEPDH